MVRSDNVKYQNPETCVNRKECGLHPPDGGWGWAVVFASFMIHVIADGITYSFGTFMNRLMIVFDEGRGSVSLIPSILVGVTLGVGPIASILVNKFGNRSVTIVGSIIGATGVGFSALAINIQILYLTIGLLTGLGFGLIYLPAIVCVSMYFEKKRAFATGIAVCGSGLGTFIMAPLTQKLIDLFDWRCTFLIMALIILSCIIFGAMFRPVSEKRSKPDETCNSLAMKDFEEVESIRAPLESVRCTRDSPEVKETNTKTLDLSLVRDPVFILYSVSNFVSCMWSNIPYVYTVDRALHIGLDEQEASFLLSFIGIANSVGRIVLGFVSDQKWVNRLYLYILTLTVCGLGIGLSNFCDSFATQLVFSAVFGVTSGASVGLTSVLLVDLLGLDKLTNAFGLLLLFQGIASVTGPPIIGLLYDHLGTYESGFYISGSAIFLSGIVLFLVPRIKTKKVEKIDEYVGNIPATLESGTNTKSI